MTGSWLQEAQLKSVQGRLIGLQELQETVARGVQRSQEAIKEVASQTVQLQSGMQASIDLEVVCIQSSPLYALLLCTARWQRRAGAIEPALRLHAMQKRIMDKQAAALHSFEQHEEAEQLRAIDTAEKWQVKAASKLGHG